MAHRKYDLAYLITVFSKLISPYRSNCIRIDGYPKRGIYFPSSSGPFYGLTVCINILLLASSLHHIVPNG